MFQHMAADNKINRHWEICFVKIAAHKVQIFGGNTLFSVVSWIKAAAAIFSQIAD